MNPRLPGPFKREEKKRRKREGERRERGERVSTKKSG
jgi:hypothetical protein